MIWLLICDLVLTRRNILFACVATELAEVIGAAVLLQVHDATEDGLILDALVRAFNLAAALCSWFRALIMI